MGIKNWPAWIKGGALGVAITLLVEIVFIIYLVAIQNTDAFAYALLLIILFWGGVLTVILALLWFIISKVRN